MDRKSAILANSSAHTNASCYAFEDSAKSVLSGLFCDRKWDEMLCWPVVSLNQTVAIPCKDSRQFVELIKESRPAIEPIDIPGMAYQYCNSKGKWAEKTDYEECLNFLTEILGEEETRGRVRHAVSVITFGLCLASMVLLLIALGIFTFFRSLNCDRLKVHKNFMLALMIRYAVSVIYYEPYIYGKPVPDVWFRNIGQGYVCKLILILLMYGYVAPVFWMFIEGLYLHSKLATNIFDSPAPFMVYYVIGWVFPLLCVISWSVSMFIQYPGCIQEFQDSINCNDTNQSCWDGYDESPYTYILSAPMTAALAINLMFLINVVRILLSKLREGATTAGPFDSQSGEGAHIFKALRAALILFPLLGITNLLFFINPKNGSQQKIYMLFNATMQSSQGIFLAILYCFLNSEVKEKIKLHFDRIQTRNDITRNYMSQNTNTASVLPRDTTQIKEIQQPGSKSEKIALIITTSVENLKSEDKFNVNVDVVE